MGHLRVVRSWGDVVVEGATYKHVNSGINIFDEEAAEWHTFIPWARIHIIKRARVEDAQHIEVILVD